MRCTGHRNFFNHLKAWDSDVSKFTSEQLQSLGIIAVGFSAADLGKMNLAADDDIESLGSEYGYTSDQVIKIKYKVSACSMH